MATKIESPAPIIEDRLLRLSEVCDRLKIDRSTLYRLVRDGKLKQIAVGCGSKRIRASSLEIFLKASEENFVNDNATKGKCSAA